MNTRSTFPAALLALSLLLPACTTTSTTQSTVQDASGRTVYSETSSSSVNEAAEAAKAVGTAVKDGVVSGYEWTKDKTVKGYNWVKEKAAANAEGTASDGSPVPAAEPAPQE